MIEIRSREDLERFFEHERAVLFFAATWSGYAEISRQMIEFVEGYAKAGGIDVPFFVGQFEDDLLPLGEELVAAGVPPWVFVGNGSLSFFLAGKHIRTMRSIIGEGTGAVWAHIEEVFGRA
jgi:hypothetical protein